MLVAVRIRDALCSSGACDTHVSCAVHDAGHPAEADEEAHVRAVGDAFDGRLLPGHPSWATFTASQIGASGSTSAGANWPPKHRSSGGCSLAGILPRHRLDTCGHEVLERIYFFAGDQTYLPLGDERLGDGGGPVASPDDAHVDGHFVL